MPDPKISIIVPIYNVEKYVQGCLESLVNQTLSDIEIICVDDCGTDNSMDFVHKFAESDSRIKVFHHQKNRGLSAARNTGMDAVSAPYVMFCDSDDEFAPDMCSRMFDAITYPKKEIDVAVCNMETVVDDDFSRPEAISMDRWVLKKSGAYPFDDNDLLRTSVTAPGKIFRMDIIKQNNLSFPEGLKFEDNYFWFLYAIFCKNIFYIPEPLYIYNRHAGSITSDALAGKLRSNSDYARTAVMVYDYMVENGLYDTRNGLYWDIFARMMWGALNGIGVAEKDRYVSLDIAVKFLKRAKNISMAPGDYAQYTRFKKFKTFGKIFKTRYDFATMVYYFLNIPIMKIRFGDIKDRYYLFGFLPIGSKYSFIDNL